MELVVKNLPVNAGVACSIPGLGSSPGGGHGNPLQYSCLENPMDRGTWWATVHRVAKSLTRLKQLAHTLSLLLLLLPLNSRKLALENASPFGRGQYTTVRAGRDYEKAVRCHGKSPGLESEFLILSSSSAVFSLWPWASRLNSLSANVLISKWSPESPSPHLS